MMIGLMLVLILTLTFSTALMTPTNISAVQELVCSLQNQQSFLTAPFSDDVINFLRVSNTICNCSTAVTQNKTKTNSNPKDDLQIVGGRPTRPHEFPEMAIITVNFFFGQRMCGATILNKNYILTAAHCVENVVPKNVKVTVGAYNRSQQEPNTLTVRVKRILTHPLYDIYDYDIAILELESTLNFNAHVAPTCIPMVKRSYQNKDGFVTGWGVISEYVGVTSPLLRVVRVPITTLQICRRAYAGEILIRETMICAGHRRGGKDACFGDSGGPLFVMTCDNCPHNQIGITSFGIGCARPGIPGVYSRVDYNIDFILHSVKLSVCKFYTSD